MKFMCTECNTPFIPLLYNDTTKMHYNAKLLNRGKLPGLWRCPKCLVLDMPIMLELELQVFMTYNLPRVTDSKNWILDLKVKRENPLPPKILPNVPHNRV